MSPPCSGSPRKSSAFPHFGAQRVRRSGMVSSGPGLLGSPHGGRGGSVRVWQAALLIGLAVFAAPLATVEQPPAQGASHRFPRGGASPAGYAHLVEAFRQGLRDLGAFAAMARRRVDGARDRRRHADRERATGRGPHHAPSAPDDRLPRVCGRRGTPGVGRGLSDHLAPNRQLRRQDPQGREAPRAPIVQATGSSSRST